MSTGALEPVAEPEKLGKSFRRIGWIGFWLQLILGAVPLIGGGVLLLLNQTAIMPGGRFDVIGYLALASLVILFLTTLWFFRYTRLGRRLEAQEATPPTGRRLGRIVWTGLVASSVGILFSTVVMVVEVAYLLVNFLEAPQAGLPVIQTTNGENGGATWISAIDMMSLMTLILMVAAEIIVLVLGLWLLYRVTQSSRSPAKAA